MISYNCTEKGRNHNMEFVYLMINNNGNETDEGVVSLADIAARAEQAVKSKRNEEVRITNTKHSSYISIEDGEIYLHQKFRKTRRYAWVSVAIFISLLMEKLF